eukprot:jgi/Tetstr1/427182/TSEL_017370.t1
MILSGERGLVGGDGAGKMAATEGMAVCGIAAGDEAAEARAPAARGRQAAEALAPAAPFRAEERAGQAMCLHNRADGGRGSIVRDVSHQRE